MIVMGAAILGSVTAVICILIGFSLGRMSNKLEKDEEEEAENV